MGWPDYENLLLGNGLSTHVCRSFSYSSLYDEAKNRGHLTQEEIRFFKATGFEQSGNFEGVLKTLLHVPSVLTAFSETNCNCTQLMVNWQISEVTKAFNKIRSALIETISDIHPTNEEVFKASILQALAGECFKCNNIFSINYDLLLYWALALTLPKTKRKLAKPIPTHNKELMDYFGDRRRFVGDKYVDSKKAYLRIHFLHGAAHLYNDKGYEYKIISDPSGGLLKSIMQEMKGQNFPVIVTAGTSEEKLSEIMQSEYLRHVYENLKHIQDRLVLFGVNLSGNDEHIFRQINSSPVKEIAVSFFEPDQSKKSKLHSETIVKAKEHFGSQRNLLAFDSSTHPLGAGSLHLR